jgi:hypothetical protein
MPEIKEKNEKATEEKKINHLKFNLIGLIFEKFPKTCQMREKDDRHDNRRQPDKREIGDSASLEFDRKLRTNRRKRQNRRDDDIQQKTERENVPDN